MLGMGGGGGDGGGGDLGPDSNEGLHYTNLLLQILYT